jgi:hypothetical protein
VYACGGLRSRNDVRAFSLYFYENRRRGGLIAFEGEKWRNIFWD